MPHYTNTQKWEKKIPTYGTLNAMSDAKLRAVLGRLRQWIRDTTNWHIKLDYEIYYWMTLLWLEYRIYIHPTRSYKVVLIGQGGDTQRRPREPWDYLKKVQDTYVAKSMEM